MVKKLLLAAAVLLAIGVLGPATKSQAHRWS